MTMLPIYKAKWLEALRSGKFRQGHEWLAMDDYEFGGRQYCCLGVLQLLTEEDPELDVLVSYNGSYLRKEDAAAIGLDYAMQEKLAELNDGNVDRGIVPQTFEQIADYIEANL